MVSIGAVGSALTILMRYHAAWIQNTNTNTKYKYKYKYKILKQNTE